MNIFFGSWLSLLRLAVIGVLAYVSLLLLLRLSGKRTLSKLNAFDWVVTVAMGSTLATALLSPNVSLLDGVSALAMLVALQLVVAWSIVRVARLRRAVKSQPRLLWYQGQFRREAMRKERVNEDEVLQAIRSAGIGSLSQVAAVVMETNGELSVLKTTDEDLSALRNVLEVSEVSLED